MVTAMRHYWLDDPDAPFHTLLCVAGTYCHPEADPDAYTDLIRLARTRPDDPQVVQVKAELVRILVGDTEGLHPDALFTAACYPDGSDLAFASRLWRHLFAGEPAPTSKAAAR